MKYIQADDTGSVSWRGRDIPVVELTRRNLQILLAKLDDPTSHHKTLIDGSDHIAVRAVENDKHYADRLPGVCRVGTEYL